MNFISTWAGLTDFFFFFPVFAKNSLIKNIFEKEKKFDSGIRYFLEIFPNWVYVESEAGKSAQRKLPSSII